MKLSFHGADRDVTGSCHLVEVHGLRILIDCGLFQGGREIDEDNAADFGFDPRAIDILLLTHAHLDHCGRIPLLVKRGFRGEIITTSATRELAWVVFLDSAQLQEEARRTTRQAHRHGQPAGLPLYERCPVVLTKVARNGFASASHRATIVAAEFFACFAVPRRDNACQHPRRRRAYRHQGAAPAGSPPSQAAGPARWD